MFRVKGMILEMLDHIPVHQRTEIFKVRHIDLLQFMAGTEAVKEMHERDGSLDSAEMCHDTDIHALLYTRRSQLGKAGLAACHGIRVISEYGNGMRADSSCCHMHNTGEHGACNAVHGRDHQHEALRGSIGGSERACFQCPVHGAAGAGFTLHLHQLNRLAEQILFSVCCPVVYMICHGTGRRDGVDGCYLCKSIAGVSGGFVAVHGFFGEHSFLPVFIVW